MSPSADFILCHTHWLGEKTFKVMKLIQPWCALSVRMESVTYTGTQPLSYLKSHNWIWSPTKNEPIPEGTCKEIKPGVTFELVFQLCVLAPPTQ